MQCVLFLTQIFFTILHQEIKFSLLNLMGNSSVKQNFFSKTELQVQLNITTQCILVCLKFIKT